VTDHVDTIRVSDDVNIDFGRSLTGMELLKRNEQLRAGDGGQLIVTDEAQGKETGVALSLA
jgi:hypothetical protein